MASAIPAFAPALAEENAGFRRELFAGLAAVEADSWWFLARNDLIAWAIGQTAAGASPVLEIGCGTGFVLQRIRSELPEADLWGSEIFHAGLTFAAERVPSAHLIQMDALHIPFREEFAAIGAFDVLEHVEDDQRVIEQVVAALRPGGTFLMTVPQHPAMWSSQDVHAGHVRRYTAGGLRGKLETAGLSIVLAVSFVSLLLPMMFASRLPLRSRPATPEFDAVEVLRQPPIVNRVLGAVMRAERTMIRHGARFPAGGSLLVAARKPDTVVSGAT
jgi:SAM-dependent methyltransferase